VAAPGDDAGLEDYVRIALENNPGVKAARQSWMAAYRRLDQVTALPDPRLTLGYFLESVETRVGPQDWTVSVAQKFPWFGKLDLQGQMAVQTAHAQFYRYQAARLALAYDVRDTYYEYWYLSRAIQTVRRMQEIVAHLEQVATAEYKANRAPYGTVMKAQVELGKLEDRLQTLQAMREPISARLAAAMALPAESPLPWPRELDAEVFDAQDDEVLQWVREGNPRLAAMAHEELARMHAVDRAELERYPDVTVALKYIDTDGAIGPTPESGKDPVMASVSVNLPIWVRKYAAAEQEARERHKAAAERRLDESNTLAADARMALYNMRDAHRRQELYAGTLVPKARQALEAQETAFSAGTASFQELLDAERVLLEFQLEQHRARADRARHLARLQMMAARPLISQQGAVTPAQKPSEATQGENDE
jgi:outer membrane protein TolC